LNLANIPSLQEAVKTAGYATHVEGKLLDVAADLQTVELLKEITKKNGRSDCFFANAGYAQCSQMTGGSVTRVRSTLDLT
jgi:NADP-dependent 3-hydroxy acid dehydrogenase YdfG